MPKLSIVIPIYNVEDYLAKCLDSVLCPDVQDYEIIAVNDGSTDSSGEIAREYAARYPERIRLIEKPNGGLGSARNAGIEAAKGEFLLFLDSDDCLSPGAVKEISEALDTDADIIFFDFVTVNEDGRQISYQRGCEKEGVFTLRDYPQLIFEYPSAWNKLWRRNLYTDNNIRFPDRLWFEDLATSPRLYLHAKRIRSVSKPWIRYLLRGNSITNSKKVERNTEIIQAVDLCLSHYREQGEFEHYHDELEYLAVYHQLLMSTSRVVQADPNSAIPMKLLADLEQKFPDFRENPYLRSMSRQHRLLLALMLRGQYHAVQLLMKANNLLRAKKL